MSTGKTGKVVDGWFTENDDLWPGQAMSYKIDEVLYEGKSKFQDILVLKTKRFGNLLVLDGIVQCSEKDECVYQEMMTHLPLFCHPNPKAVLVIGGGDGGIVRELDKHSSVEKIVLCEIDEDVIEVSKKYFPSMGVGFQSTKLDLHIGDGCEFMKHHQKTFDLIITDSSDQTGPSSTLVTREYYSLVAEALRPNGIHITHDDGPWLEQCHLHCKYKMCKTLFLSTSYCYASIPTYPCGELGFVLSSISSDVRFDHPLREVSQEMVRMMGFKYYNSDVHKSSFVLPQFAKETLGIS